MQSAQHTELMIATVMMNKIVIKTESHEINTLNKSLTAKTDQSFHSP